MKRKQHYIAVSIAALSSHIGFSRGKAYSISCAFFIFGLIIPSKGSGPLAHVASINITPPIEMQYPLGGYGERMNKPAEGIHDPIWAKALAFRKGNDKYVIITLDLLGLPHNVKSDLVKRVSSLGWSMDNMMLLPSHSHGSLEMSALNNKNELNIPQIGIFHPALLEFILDRLESLVKEVDQHYQPFLIGTESIVIDGLNRNRRKDPDVDKELLVTRIDHLNGEPMAVLVNWTAHPTFLGEKDMLVSAEWPGYLQTHLQELIGHGVTVMYYNGAEGDQSPIMDGPMDGYEKIQRYGKTMAVKAHEVYKVIKPKKIKSFSFSYQVIPLPEHVAHPSFMKTGGDEYGLDNHIVKTAMDMICPTEVGLGAIRIGDLLIVGVPGEMTAEMGLKVKKSLKTGNTIHIAIGGLANEWISYILSRHQYLHGEGYESSVSFYGSDLGPMISDQIIHLALPLTQKR